MKHLLKQAARAAGVAFAFPFALLSGFGKIAPAFTFFSQWFALVPGLLGDYLRVCWYSLTLESCSLSARISFGSFCAHRQTTIADQVYIGSYTILGKCDIGSHCQIASHVQVLSGRKQHPRDEQGGISSSHAESFVRVRIGAHCWIGAGALVMADVESHSTVGAGSVVIAPVPPYSVAVGNPAKVVRTLKSA